MENHDYSGSFLGWTQPRQQKFLPDVFWETKRESNGWRVDVTVKYKCYDAYLGKIDGSYIDITVSNGGGTKHSSTRRIEDGNRKMHHGLWIDTQTFHVPYDGNTNLTHVTINLAIRYMRKMNYSNIELQKCYAEGTAKLKEPYSACTAPTSVTVSPSSGEINTTVTISWSDARPGMGNNINGYYIQKKKGNGPWTDIKTIDGNITNWSETLSSIIVDQEIWYRVKTRASLGAQYDSGWSEQSNAFKSLNSRPVMSSVNCNTAIVPYNKGEGGTASFSWSGSDKNKDSLRYAYVLIPSRTDPSTSYSSYTTNTSRTLSIKGTSGSTYYLKVKAYDGRTDSDPLVSSSGVKINIIPTTPQIEYVNSNGATMTLSDRPPFIYYKISSTISNSGKASFQLTLQTSATSDFSGTVNSYSLGTFTGEKDRSSNKYITTYYLSLTDKTGVAKYIGENYYYRIRVRVYDGYDYSKDSFSIIKQNNTSPNISVKPTNSYTESNVEPYDGVYFKVYDVIKQEGESYTEEDLFRLRLGSIVKDNVVLNWTLPAYKELPGIANNSAKIKYLRLYRSISNDSNTTNWIEIYNLDLNVGNETDFNNLPRSYIDNISELEGSRIKYKIIFEDIYGWQQVNPDDNDERAILMLKRNTPPQFANTYIRLNQQSYSGTPTIHFYGEDNNLTVTWAKTSADSDSDGVLITPGDGVPPSIMSTPDKFIIKLIFKQDPFLSNPRGYPVDVNGEDIKEIELSSWTRATANDLTYNITTFTLSEDMEVEDGKKSFKDFNVMSKRQSYSNVVLEIESEDTFGEKSINKISTPIILDFRQKPVMPSTEEDLKLYTLKDATNEVNLLRDEQTEILEAPHAYADERNYMINSKEQLEFKFPKAISPNPPEDSDGIYSYIIYYSTSTIDNTPDESDFRILTEIEKGRLIEENGLLTYLHTVTNYNENTYVRLGIAARDIGYGSDPAQRFENSLISDIITLPYRLMACRNTYPSFSLEGIDFETISTENRAPVEVYFSIDDIGGSRNDLKSSYWEYRNFERFTTGRFFQLELILSTSPYFPEESTTIYKLPKWCRSGETWDWSYPPSDPEEKPDDNDKEVAYPWTNVLASTDVTEENDGRIDTRLSYYAKLRLKIGYNSKSVISDDSTCYVVESKVGYLRSLRSTLAIRDKRVGINTMDPEFTLRVSAGNENEETGLDYNYVQFDSGIDGDTENIIKFDLITGHMIRGTIDCGRLL